MRSLFVRAILPALILAACDTPTDSPLNELLVERAQWQAQGLTDYSYVWEQDGFFNSFAGQPIRLQIRGGVLQSAVFVATGDSVPGPLTWFPTIDQMFEQAIAAAHGQTLHAVAFDHHYHYPVRMDLDGPADASGSIRASELAPAIVPYAFRYSRSQAAGMLSRGE